MRKPKIRLVLSGLIIVLIVMQFFRVDKSVSEVNNAKDFIKMTDPPDDIVLILENACYDCHSNKTDYPWYAEIAPVSWWIKNHIDEAREHLNFSTWGDYSPKRMAFKLKEVYEEVEEGEMPLKSYKFLHPESRMNVEQKKRLLSWVKELHSKQM